MEDDFKYEMIEGYPCETLESIIKFKKEKGRSKDIIDLEKIEEYLKRTS